MTEWPPIREIAGHSACYMFSKYLIVSVFFFFFFFFFFVFFFVFCCFFRLGYWSGNFFLIASFPDHCILLLFYMLEACADFI